MSFAEGFYSFTLNISDASRGIYGRQRIKIARHPEEPLQYLYARVVAFVASYEENLKFSPGYFEPKEPTLFQKSVIGETTLWVEVGCPSKEKITRAIKSFSKSRFKVFFYTNQQIEDFCHYLRGSKSNWAENIQFYEIEESFIEKLSEKIKSSTEWSVTLVDNAFYLVFDDMELDTLILPINIWARYQDSIFNTRV